MRFIFATMLLLASVCAQRPSSSEARLDQLERTIAKGGDTAPIASGSGLQTTLKRFGGSHGSSHVARGGVMYHVLAGRGSVTAARKHDLEPGVIVHASAGSHRFESEKGVTVLVVEAEATPHTGGMAAGPRPTQQTAYPETSPRGSTRIFYWFGPGSAGQLAIDYGTPVYKPAYKQFMTTPSGRRWRFGQNFWTRLDTNIDLTLGGVKVPAGYWYLMLEHDAKKGLMLVALDPKKARSGLLDAWHAPKTKAHAGIEIPLAHRETKQGARRLSIELAVDRAKEDTGTLTIRFGPHVLTAPLVMHARK